MVFTILNYNNFIKYSLSLIILVFFSSCTSLSVSYVNVLAKLGEYKTIQDLPYTKENNKTLDIYIPKNASKKDPSAVIVFFYGGCWGECISLYKADYLFVADALTSKGYVVVIADYRMSPEVNYAQIINDAQMVVEWTHAHIQLYFGDKENLFIMGHSSGAHLAIMLSLNENYLNVSTRKSIKGGIGLAGPYDFLPYTEAYLPHVFGDEKDAAYSQPINYVHEHSD